MKLLKKLYGKILYRVARILSGILEGFIQLINMIAQLITNLAKGCFVLVSMGGCLLLLLIAGPLGITILGNPILLTIVFLLILFIMLTPKMVSYLEYIKVTTNDYLMDRSNYFIQGTQCKYKKFREYKAVYKKAEEERKRREAQQRAYEQQKQWEERFKNWHGHQQYHNGQGYYGGQGHQGFGNYSMDFKSQYEKCCDVLGVSYEANKNEIKLAYRKKAKMYHPDMNSSQDTTEMFQKINDAYEFLTEDHIERYKRL
ncbi:DnaJ-like protein [Natranaerovirga hydrolytica]|uniref:DnaJ-like protein n=1 Tax=Natranaerovirga hydrolytica TaxID=680378 RepID=A0A4R1MN81_9FIRM|nr:DnaJ domain-containing protein [Natranaerovirga hydrolytica]TCK92754.1 DnaJ-like protein [Natranaerovirga hydrolytica]